MLFQRTKLQQSAQSVAVRTDAKRSAAQLASPPTRVAAHTQTQQLVNKRGDLQIACSLIRRDEVNTG